MGVVSGSWWPLALYATLIAVTLGGVMALSAVVGGRHRAGVRDLPYESGMLPTGSARAPITPQYYLVAMLFVVFDLEAAFLYVWAVSVREAGWTGLAEVAVFVGVLLVALVWLVRLGALDWAPSQRHKER